MGSRHGDQGRFVADHSDEDVVAAVREHEPAATSEVAGELGIARQSADYRLRKLRETGEVASKKIGASLVWYLPRGDSTRNISSETSGDIEREMLLAELRAYLVQADERIEPGHLAKSAVNDAIALLDGGE